MNILVTGASGMLGIEVCRAAVKRLGRENVVGLTHYDLDICDEGAVKLALNKHWPALSVNCRLFTIPAQLSTGRARRKGRSNGVST